MRKIVVAGIALLFLATAGLVLAQPARDKGKKKGKDKRKIPADRDDTPSQRDTSDSKKSKLEYVGGKTLLEWKALLKSKDPSVRTQAIVAITAFGNDNSNCGPLLIDRAADKDVSPRVKAVIALRFVAISDKDFPKVVTSLCYRMSPQSESQTVVRLEAIITLQRYVTDPLAATAIPYLAAAVTRDT